MSQSTKTKSAGQAAKPYPDFPLFPHATGRWAKKIRGKLCYFGRGTWQEALDLYEKQRDALYAGRKPRETADGYTLRDLLNKFLEHKRHLLDTRQLTNRTFEDYKRTTDWLAEILELDRVIDDFGPDDFLKVAKTVSKRYGLVGLGGEINKTRIIFKFAFDTEMIDRPVRFGPTFKRPSRTALRKQRASRPKRLFTAAELQTLIDAAGPQVRAMLLLAINAGLGNADVGLLRFSAIDLKKGWLDYPRPKTGIDRRVKLWPETVEALQVAIANRPKHKDPGDAELVFLTRARGRWHKDTPDNALSKGVAKLLTAKGLKRDNLNFYAIRHTFETIAGGCRDQVCVNHIMGHSPAPTDMSSVYREHIEDSRIEAVVAHVHDWLYPKAKASTGQKRPRRKAG